MRLLDQVQIAKPCSANWDEMKGDERVRHCALCRHKVYNVAEMTRDEAERLLREHEGRLCFQIFRREDGTILTRDCPKGLRAFRQRAAKRLVLALSMVLSAVGCGPVGDRLKADFGFKPTPTPMPALAIRGKIAVMAPSKTTSTVTCPPKKVNP